MLAQEREAEERRIIEAEQAKIHHDELALAALQERERVVDAARQAAAECEQMEKELAEQANVQYQLDLDLQEKLSYKQIFADKSASMTRERIEAEQRAAEVEQEKIAIEQQAVILVREQEAALYRVIEAEQEQIRVEELVVAALQQTAAVCFSYR